MILLEEANHREIAYTLRTTEDTVKQDAKWLRDNDLLP